MNDYSGKHVSMSEDGKIIAIHQSVSVRVFEYSNSSWSAKGSTIDKSDTEFGVRVKLSSDGSKLFVSSQSEFLCI